MKAELPIPPPRITWRGVTLAGLGWGLYALAFAAYSAQVVQTSFPTAVLHQLQGNAILALLSIPIWLLTVCRMDRTGWGWKIAVYALIAPLYAVGGFEAIAMILQSLVENAIKHGIAPAPEGGKLLVQIRAAKELLRFVVRDTGIGVNGRSLEELKALGTGLKNSDERLRHLFGAEAQLRLQTSAGGGFQIDFSLPLEPQ